MRRILLATLVALTTLGLFGLAPARAITYGEVDGDLHPNVGALVAEFDGVKDWFCSGTLISPEVFLTAAHCTAWLEPAGIEDVWVTFDPVFDATTGTFFHGTAVTNPGYNPTNLTGDVAVVLLDAPVAGIQPAHLPTEGYLDGLKAAGKLQRVWITNVGYGGTIEFKQHPPELSYDGIRRFSVSPVRGLTKHHLVLLMNNDATDGGGTCFGDSGGPHFVRDSDLLVAATSWGDAWCRALDQTARIDIPSIRSFLDDYVTLP
jgi:secreted trypsin-like serine protease